MIKDMKQFNDGRTFNVTIDQSQPEVVFITTQSIVDAQDVEAAVQGVGGVVMQRETFYNYCKQFVKNNSEKYEEVALG